MPSVYSGCVYKNPPRRYDPQGVEDLSDHALSLMKLSGLPVKESHSGKTIGTVTDEWSGSDGSKHITFSIDSEAFPVAQMGLDTRMLDELSLSHVVGSPPTPLEVSVCSRGRRQGTVISRLSPEEYKRSTFVEEQSTNAEQENIDTALSSPQIVMASNNAMDPSNQGSLPTEVSPATAAANAGIPMQQDPQAAAQAPAQGQGEPAPAQDAGNSGASSLAATDPDKYMEIFRGIVDKLQGDDKRIFVEKQLQDMKNMAEVQQELEKTKQESAKMQASHTANLNATMQTIRNFFLQGADQNRHDGLTAENLSEVEAALEKHPELQAPIGQLVQCAARRTTTAESNMVVHQKAVEQTAAERELFDRMRGLTRDSAEPTYSYHGFEQAGSKRPAVSQNANVADVAPPAKRAKTSGSFDAQLQMIAAGMRSTLPMKPSNIGSKEQFPAR